MSTIRQTPSQTVGPFFAYGLTARQYGYDFTSIIENNLIGEDYEGERIYITGRVFDGDGKVIPDAMLELTQADARGKFNTGSIQNNHSGFIGFGRMGTGTTPDNSFRFITIKPGPVNGQVPFINIILFMRGSLRHLYTRLYFSDEANENDELLKSVDTSRKQTLIARRVEKNGTIEYHFDIHMQGEKETVFFNL